MIRVEVVPCLTDNYAYLIINEKNQAVLIDVPEAEPIVERINAQGLTLDSIFLTHHHSDHIDGLEDMVRNGVPVFANRQDHIRIPHPDIWIKPGEHVTRGKMRIDVLPADGHTIGHVIYSIPQANALFTADSIMFWGCGRLFEGTPKQMWETLERIMEFPPETLIYSGHNYGETNGRFALSLGGYTDRMEERMRKVQGLNAENVPVCPASLKEELETNPFLLARDDTYAAELGIADKSPLERFTHIRNLRDNF